MSFFVKKITDEWGGVVYQPTTAGFTALVIIMIAVLLIGVYLFGRKKHLSPKHLVFSAVAIALSMITSMIKIINMPMGGSVTLLSMLFVSMIGYWYGLGAGLTTAFAYGVLQLVIDPYIISLPQMLVDYIFAFMALGLSGIFSKSKNGLSKGYIVGVLGRYFFTFLSGWIFFGTYAADAGFKSAVLYSLVYNGAYLGAEAVITLIIINLPPVKQALGRVTMYARDLGRS